MYNNKYLLLLPSPRLSLWPTIRRSVLSALDLITLACTVIRLPVKDIHTSL